VENADWIASRTFQFDGGGIRRDITVGFYRPIPDSQGDWICRFTILGVEEIPFEREIYGIDSLQALLGAFKVCAAFLEQKLRAEGCSLFWMGTVIPPESIFEPFSEARTDA
jgi:hypothetical protein